MSQTESNYSDIEHELLRVLFAITHFKHFTYGHTVHVITGHKPLVSLFKKSLVNALPRLIRMLMHLLDYTLNVSYQPGERMHLSDALSCLSSHNMAAEKTIKNLDVSICDIRTMYRQAGRLTDASRPSFCASKHLTDKVGNPVEAGLTVWKDSTLPDRSKVFRARINTCLHYYF